MFTLVSFAVASRFSQRNSDKFFNQALVDHINSQRLSWKAATKPYPHFANRTVAETKKLFGTRTELRGTLPKRTYGNITAYPDSFDSRTNWPNCPTLKQIRDQSACGSCWAFGAAESISDRYCTYLGTTNPRYQNVQISANDINSCCDSCGNGCGGGYPEAAFQYWKDTGITTDSCDPYPFPKCEHHVPKKHYDVCPSTEYDTPACPATCADGTPFSGASRYFASDVWSVDGSEDAYKAELMKGGPFEITLSVYADFTQYSTGVYRHQSGDLLGGHAVKLLGWGVDAASNLPYWTVANSWNEDWGETGTFRIVRGTNECGIESGGVAGQPKAL